METARSEAGVEELERERSEAERRLADSAKYKAEAEQQVKQIQTPPSLARSYRFLSELGHGGQAHVYLARRFADDRLVTIKQLNIDSVKAWKEYELFHREAEVLSGLNIPGVARFFDAIECLEDTPPCSYIIQEYIEGASLARMMKDGHRFQTNDVYDILLQMLRILKQLQRREPPIIHRDIKPSNIMISPAPGGGYKVTLIDFGAVANPQVQSGGSTVAGTYGYMPPEQLMGRPQPASDIYSLGAVAVELFSGVSPAEIPVKDFRLIFEPEVQQLPVSVVNTLRSMLEPKAEDRLADIDKLIDLFGKYKNEQYDIDNIKPADIDKDRAVNRKLKEVTTICEPGNMDLWQHLPDKTPRTVPEYYLELLRDNNIYGTNSISDAVSLGANRTRRLVVAAVIALIASMIAPGFFGLTGFVVAFCVCIFLLFLAIVFGSSIDGTAMSTKYDSIKTYSKNKVLIDLITNGRKTVAKIDSVEYLPMFGNRVVKDSHGLKVVNALPSFLVKYRFNPPDDARSEDLVHEFVSHAAPENQYSVGDPLPILYKIEPKYFGDTVISMPYPYPGDGSESPEVVFQSDSGLQSDFKFLGNDFSVSETVKNSYDYTHHYQAMMNVMDNRKEVLERIQNSIWLIDDYEVMVLTLKFADSVFSSNDFELRAAFVESLLKIYHYAKVAKTRQLAIDYLSSYFDGAFSPHTPEKREFIRVYSGYTYNDLPDSFWDAYLRSFEKLDDSAFLANKWEWYSYRLAEIPRRVSARIKSRSGAYY